MMGAAAFCLPLLLALPSCAASPDEIYAEIVTTIVTPGFTNLQTRAHQHAADWAAQCADGATADGSAVTASFHELADAWAAVEMFRSGPAAKDFRRDRFSLWPERKNAVGRALAAARATPPDVAMTDDWMSRQSAAIQGLPVLERLLFGDGETAAPPQPGTADCRLGIAVSRNAERLASDMAADWSMMDDPPDAAGRSALATDIVTGIALAKDEKVEAVIGPNEEQMKPRLAEFWRSRRSIRNLVLNMETYTAIARITAGDLDEPVMPYAAKTVSETLAAMHEPLADYGKTEQRSEANFLKAALDSLGDSAAKEVSAALGVTVGFNSSDGD